jgi:hypothetical protein
MFQHPNVPELTDHDHELGKVILRIDRLMINIREIDEAPPTGIGEPSSTQSIPPSPSALDLASTDL